jgi:hypothetical protein
MKTIKKGLKRLIRAYKMTSDKYVPIYTGDTLLGFGKRGEL